MKVEKTKDHSKDLVFLCDQNNKMLHDCDNNTEQLNRLMDLLKSKNIDQDSNQEYSANSGLF